MIVPGEGSFSLKVVSRGLSQGGAMVMDKTDTCIILSQFDSGNSQNHTKKSRWGCTPTLGHIRNMRPECANF